MPDKQPAPTEQEIRELLKAVYDPEIGINVVDLGLIYGVEIAEGGKVTVRMTLTTPACPVGPMLHHQVAAVTASLPGVEDVEVKFVWSPPWDPHTMCSEEAKLELGIW
ncbi:MAG: metal-sulfur cluster assembly factor [Chloroflexi bacterium]|nr:metal-sulfur cluster assembly factor [Chloroflexota bacterium]